MKHLKKYKLFESVDLVSLESTLNDIALELVDNGYKVSIDLIRPKVLAYYSKETETPVWKDGDPDGIRIEVSSPRKESLYSQWRQDRENFAKREHEKCKDVLDRLDTVLISNGLTATIRNNVGMDSKGNFTASSLGFGSGGYSNLEHGECHQGFDYTGHWVFSIVYRKSKLNEGIFSNRKWWFQKGKNDPDRVFNNDLKMDIEDVLYELSDSKFTFHIATPDPSRVKDSRRRSTEMSDPNWYEKSVYIDISRDNKESFSFDQLIDKIIFMMSYLKDKWDIELRSINVNQIQWSMIEDRNLFTFRSEIKNKKTYIINTNYFSKVGLRNDKSPSLFRTGLPAYNEDNLRKDMINYFKYFKDLIVELTLVFKIG